MWTVQVRILTRIRRKGRGRVFVPKDFLDVGSREAVDQALARLVRSNELERLSRGLYRLPASATRGIRIHDLDHDEVASALARQTGCKLVPSGTVAASRLGLAARESEEQVYLTDGRARRVRVGASIFVFKHIPPKDLPPGGGTSALVFQALQYLGRAAIDEAVVAQIRSVLTPKSRQELLKDVRYATGWIAEVARQVADEPVDAARG